MQLVELKVLSSEHCFACMRLRALWARLALTIPHVRMREIDILTEEGQHLLVAHRVRKLPGLLYEGHLLASGTIDEQTLRQSLEAITA